MVNFIKVKKSCLWRMILLSGIRSEGFVFIEEGGHYWEARISYNNCFSDGELVLLRTSLVFFKIPTCLYNSTMHSARFLFLYYNSPINLCMILLAILHQLVHIQGNNPHLCKCLSFYYFCWKEKNPAEKILVQKVTFPSTSHLKRVMTDF